MPLPDTYTSVNETGCCPFPNIEAWDDSVVSLADRPFIKADARSILHMPLGFTRVLAELDATAERGGAKLPDEKAMVLSQDFSPWRWELLYRVSKPVEGATNVTLEGTYLAKAFDGPYREAKYWYADLSRLALERGRKDAEVYFFFMTCPSCAKHYGKNYAMGLARIS